MGNVGGCRGEMINPYVKASSPDGPFQFEGFPVRSFSFAGDQMMLQAMQAGAQAGGCKINQPFNAQQYIGGFARMDLQAQASNIRLDQEACRWHGK